MTALQRLQATVYVVGIGGVAGISLKGETLLKRIAVQMGGRAFFPIREEQLPDVHAAVAADAFNRYIISYTPQKQAELLFGTGRCQRFPRPELLRPFMAARIGVEIMDTAAACRTYNILALEGRNVAAALLIE